MAVLLQWELGIDYGICGLGVVLFFSLFLWGWWSVLVVLFGVVVVCGSCFLVGGGVGLFVFWVVGVVFLWFFE